MHSLPLAREPLFRPALEEWTPSTNVRVCPFESSLACRLIFNQLLRLPPHDLLPFINPSQSAEGLNARHGPQVDGKASTRAKG